MRHILRTLIVTVGFAALAPSTQAAAATADLIPFTQLTLEPSPAARLAPLYLPLYLADTTEPSASSSTADEISLGEDFTKPQRRIDIRMEYESINGGNDRYIQTTRLERPFHLSEHWELGLRVDVPVAVGNDAYSSPKTSGYRTGLEDVLTQCALVDTIGERLKWGFGTQVIFPSATEKEFGNGKYRLVPTVGVRYALPEISKGSYVSPLFRYDVSVVGQDDRKDISTFEFAPELNIKLSRDWYVDFFPSTDIRYNFMTDKWFVPIDVQIGKRITPSIVASLEGSYGIIKDYNYYNFKVEFRIGFFY